VKVAKKFRARVAVRRHSHRSAEKNTTSVTTVTSRLCANIVHFSLFFSLAKTWPEFCRLPHHPANLRMLDGLKVMSIIWIIFGHTLLWQVDNLDARSITRMQFLERQRWYWQFIYNAFPSVDTFLFAGGFLAVHFLIKHTQRKRTSQPPVPKEMDNKAPGEHPSLGDIELIFVTGKSQPVALGTADPFTIDLDDLVLAAVPEVPLSADQEEDTNVSAAHSRVSLWRTIKSSLYIYLHRWLRLTPAYGLVILYFANLYNYGFYGYPWSKPGTLGQAPTIGVCYDYWWTNLLYVNNLYPDQFTFAPERLPTCMGWAWYLGVDFQLFLVAVPIGLIFIHRPRLCYALVSFLMLSVVGIRAALVASYNLGACEGSDVDFFDVVYIKPYTRGVPYLAGMLLAMQNHSRPAFLRNPSALTRTLVQIVAYVLLLATVLLRNDEKYSSGLQIGTCRWGDWAGNAALAMRNIIWTAGLYLLGWGMIQGWRTWANSFLSWHGFVFLSRFTLGAYLLHPLVIGRAYDTIDDKYNVSQDSLFITMLGVTIVSFFSAFVMYIGVELPLTSVTRALLLGRIV
jgi:hypothetical protein